ncbi:MAG: type IV secretion system protein, partial [Rickettsiaceae bacterium]|nr:type IV secretion system protein [Rickettsiaceae bacterium]
GSYTCGMLYYCSSGVACKSEIDTSYPSRGHLYPCQANCDSSHSCSNSNSTSLSLGLDRGEYYNYTESVVLPAFSSDTTFFYSDHQTSTSVAVPQTVSDYSSYTGFGSSADCNSAAASLGYIQTAARRFSDNDYYTYKSYSAASEYLRGRNYAANSTSAGSIPPLSFIMPSTSTYPYWLIEGDGLIMKYTRRVTPAAITQTSSSTSILRPIGALSSSSIGTLPAKLLYSNTITSDVADSVSGAYLQLSYMDIASSSVPSQNVGGYVLYLQQTACVRTNGESITDFGYTNRGQIKYYIASSEYDLNTSGINLSQFPSGVLDVDSSGNATITVDSTYYANNTNSHLWLIVDNKSTDYQNSYGSYNVTFNTSKSIGAFSADVLLPLFAIIDTYTTDFAMTAVQTAICYNTSDKSDCSDFFLFVKALLIAYVCIVATSFMFGMLEINAQTLMIHLVKIILVGGLISGDTFTFFNAIIAPLLVSFVDGILCDLGNSDSDPFAFLDDLFTRILMNPITYLQLLSLISFGITGFFNFVFVFAGIILILICNIAAIASYIYSKFMIAFLLFIGPLFICFCLFSFTRPLFERWINNIVIMLMEPVILCTGIAIFTQLVMKYLDRVLSYSVCFKCAIPFTLGTVTSIVYPAMPAQFQNIQLFCFYWFAPWGISSNYGLLSLSFSDGMALLFLGYFAYTYHSTAMQISAEIFGAGAFSTIQMGSQSQQKAAQQIQKLGAVASSGKSPAVAGKIASQGAKSASSKSVSSGSTGGRDGKGDSGGIPQSDDSD